jgi:hypothetical protein
MMVFGRTAMATSTLTLEVERARAEAASRTLRNWEPSDDRAAHARHLEAHIREMLGAPSRLKALVKDVFEGEPTDGTIFEYMNRQRLVLIDCFRFTLEDLRATAELARASVQAGHPVPSLAALGKVIGDVEFVEQATLAHWVEFRPDEKPDPDGGIPTEEAFRDLEEALSPELRRELQDRLELQRRSARADMGSV